MNSKTAVVKSTAERAKVNIRNLKLYVPNSVAYGACKAFDLFGSTYAYHSLICDIDKIISRSGRRPNAVLRKSHRDWNVLYQDFSIAAINNHVDIVTGVCKFGKEKYGKTRTTRCIRERK